MRLALATLAAAGCAQGLAKTPKPDAAVESVLAGQTFGVPGEAMEYQVALRGITVGRVQVAVGQPGWIEGRRAIIVRSRGASAGFLSIFSDLRWELTTTLDMETGLPLHELHEVWLTFKGEAEHERDENRGRGDYNLHAAAGALRGWRSQVGQRATFDVRVESAHFAVELSDAAREHLASAQAPAVRYDGIARGKYRFSVWISDDEARVPLRLSTDTKWGNVTVELVSYETPK